VYAAGALTKFYTDTFFDELVKVNSTLVPIDNTTSKFAGARALRQSSDAAACSHSR
jgi:hypothetical protein